MKTIALVLALAFSGVLSAGEEAAGSTAIFAWDAVTVDVLGNPETIDRYELAAFPAGTDLSTASISSAISKVWIAGTETQSESEFLREIPFGSKVRLGVRAYDLAGNVSDWSDPLDLKLDFYKPIPPGQLKKIWPLLVGGGLALMAVLDRLLRRKKEGAAGK